MASMSDSLFTWVGTLAPFVQRKSQPIPEDFKDGVMLAKILKEVVDPEFFSDIKTSSTDAPALINLSKRMGEYLLEQAGRSLPNGIAPNIPRIVASGDVREISRLLQLLLVCAVNSPRREEFISRIQTMETGIQTDIVAAIQEIMDAREEGHSLGDDDLIEMQLKKARSEITALQEDKDLLSQQCHELTQNVSQMTVEKSTLLAENEQLRNQLSGALNDPESLHPLVRNQDEMKRELEQLRDRNYELEGVIDDFKVKNQVLQKQISETHFKMASAASAEEEVMRLKDEMDSLREMAAKASHYEKQLKTLQKKLEEMSDLKQAAKLLEEKNTELLKTNFALSDENKKIQNFKNQIDALKKDLTETQQQLSQEKHKATKANFDCNQARERVATMEGQVHALQEEKHNLLEMLEELRMNSGVPLDKERTGLRNVDDCSMELLPPSVRQKLVGLELENKKLREELQSAISNDPSYEGSKVLVEQLRKREEELDTELLAKSQELADVKSTLQAKIRGMESTIAAKDEELRKKEQQYKKCMEKAQSVIKTLEPTTVPGMDAAKAEELEKARSVREMEDKLLQSAFYHYGIALHHKAVETRNKTFLGAHRQNVSGRRRSELP